MEAVILGYLLSYCHISLHISDNFYISHPVTSLERREQELSFDTKLDGILGFIVGDMGSWKVCEFIWPTIIMVQFRKKYRRSWNLCNYFCLIESWIISYWRTEIRLYCVCSWSCFMRYQGVWVWTLIAIPGSQSVVRPFRFTYWLITDELGLHLNSLITNQWKRQQSQIMSVTPPGVLSVGSGWLVLSVLSVSGDGWWPRGQASWCHGSGPGPRHGPGQHRSQEARAQHHHHWVSAFCHHPWWW